MNRVLNNLLFNNDLMLITPLKRLFTINNNYIGYKTTIIVIRYLTLTKSIRVYNHTHYKQNFIDYAKSFTRLYLAQLFLTHIKQKN